VYLGLVGWYFHRPVASVPASLLQPFGEHPSDCCVHSMFSKVVIAPKTLLNKICLGKLHMSRIDFLQSCLNEVLTFLESCSYYHLNSLCATQFVALESQTMSVLFCVSFVNAPDQMLSLKGTDPTVVEVCQCEYLSLPIP
jgi:hypothetical protein